MPSPAPPRAGGAARRFSEYNLRAADPRYMIRTRRYKYILNEGTTGRVVRSREDPGECVNQIDDPALVSVRAELYEHSSSSGSIPADNRFRP